MTKDGSNARKSAAREHAATHQVPYTEPLRETAEPPRARVTAPVPIRTADRVLIGHVTAVWGVAWHPDGTMFASGGDNTVRLWDLATGQQTSVLNTDDGVLSVAWSPDGTTIAVGCTDGSVTFWTIATGRVITRTGYSAYVYSVAFSPDSATVATSGREQLTRPVNAVATVQLWDVATGAGTALSERPDDGGRVSYGYALAFHPSGELLACSGDSAGELEIWDLATRQRTTMRCHDTSVMTLAFSPDGRTLVTGGMVDGDREGDGTVRLWDFATRQLVATARPQARHVTAVSCSPDGRVVASSSLDPTIRLWDATTGQPLATLFGHTSDIAQHAFSPDGRVLLSAGRDSTVRLWNLD